eukprot:GAHX01000278.1.p1 GENE.GAHX01000278.1~~GAHX01000278.1.p1  ORF type:complete len:413 (-),score=67.50 GAHX01000278.1:36-1241(-)
MTLQENEVESIESFREMKLKDTILHGIHSHGFVDPSVIQQKAINPIAMGRNVLAQAQSGTGKTAAFTLGMLERIDETSNTIQALVLAPTRELAIQIHEVIHSLSQHTNIMSRACIGGTQIMKDKQAIRNGVHILIGTPGRLLQLIDPSALPNSRPGAYQANLLSLKIIVIDEADELLSRGFMSTVSSIFKACPQEAQVVLVSATFNSDVEKLADEIVSDPVKILVKDDELSLEGIRQTIVKINPEEKVEFIKSILNVLQVQMAIIYCQSVESCMKIFNELKASSMPVEMMHGKLEQSERTKIMEEFKSGNIRFIVTTNLMARGIDVQSLGIVFNYELPRDNASYLHRVGRAGRFGKKGLCVNIISTKEDEEMLESIKECYGTSMEDLNSEIIKEWSRAAQN